MGREKMDELFDKFSIDTLESIEILLKYSEDKDNLYSSFRTVFIRKEEENKDEYEGMNEYDDITRVSNFNLSEITTKIDSFDKEELYFLKNIIGNAIVKIPPKVLESKIMTALSDEQSLIDEKLPVELSNEELKILFSKYSTLELNSIQTLFKYAVNKDTTRANTIINKMHEDHDEECFDVKRNNSDLLFILNGISDLTLRELEYLYTVVADAGIYLANVQTLVGSELKLPYNEVEKLYFVIQNEIAKRKENINKKRMLVAS